MKNYPDDIRQYDHDPRSPFYVEPPEPDCGACKHFETRNRKRCGLTGRFAAADDYCRHFEAESEE